MRRKKYQPKHAKKKIPFFKRPGQRERLGMSLMGLSLSFIIVAPDFPGAKPLLVHAPGWAAAVIVSMFTAGWLAGSVYYSRHK
jgi:hypothetical protein